MSKELNITQASGFGNLSSGSHSITIKAKDSTGKYGPSQEVSCGNVTVYSITPTLTNVKAQTGNATNMTPGQTTTLYYYPDTDYELPASVSVNGATGTWSLYDAYPITATLTNCTLDGVTEYQGALGVSESIALKVKATEQYSLPDSVSVTNCTNVYTKTSAKEATLTISNATGDVTITITGA